MAEVNALNVADAPELWREMGFQIDAGVAVVSGVRHVLGGPGTGIGSWEISGPSGFTELPTVCGERSDTPATPTHPNGVCALDHVVVMTPDLSRTIAAFEAGGMPLRRTRDVGSSAHPMTQAFFKLGHVVLEIVGSPTESGAGPARFWGLTFTVRDLEATESLLGQQLRPSKPAVQAGRRIATLDRAVGSSVPIAFMSARPPRP